MCSKIAAVILALGIYGCCKTENQGYTYEPCSGERLSTIAGFPVGDWKIDENSLEFLRTEFNWTALTNQCDHWLAIHNDGTALVRARRGAYDVSGDVNYKCQLNDERLSVESAVDELISLDMLSSKNYNAGCRANAYRMQWKVVRREELLRLKEDTFGDYFDRYYFNVEYPNQFEVGVMFFKGREELFFAVGEDAGGVYLTPRVYRNCFNPGLMELALKFRKVL